MATEITISQNEHGLVRLFKVDLPADEALSLTDEPARLASLLGASALDMEQLEIFDVADLAGLGLESYLAEGHGIDDADLAPHRWHLDALEGPLLILRSAALTHRPETLRPKEPLRWIATFGEARDDIPLTTQIETQSAQGQTASDGQGLQDGPVLKGWLAASVIALGVGGALTLWLALR